MLVAPLTSKQLGCKNTIEACGTPTKKLQGDAQATRRGHGVWKDGVPLSPVKELV
jgi:hypothetical protein